METTQQRHLAVDEPIINSPFEEPNSYWVYDTATGQPVKATGRRPAHYYFRSRRRQDASQTSFFAEEEMVELKLVNDIRAQVRKWRAGGYKNASYVTKQLLRHWTSPERERKLFFCQIEAAETIIWLNEIHKPGQPGINIPKDESNEDGQAALIRQCIKMATGSGKTIVMGMLIAWSVLNKIQNRQAKWCSEAVKESATAFAKRVLKNLASAKNILVINDEAHHAYRPAPIDEDDPKAAKLTAAEKKEKEEATVWISGLDRINQSRGINLVVDLTATPFYIHGSGYPEGSPLPWIVSDFGLVDAIECGIVKIPQVPFEVIPVKKKPVGPAPPPKPTTLVKALPEREAFKIEFPRVEGFIYKVKSKITANIAEIEPIVIDPGVEPTKTVVRARVGYQVGQVGLSGPGSSEKQTRETFYKSVRPQQIHYEIARRITMALLSQENFKMQARQLLFPQVLQIIRAFAKPMSDGGHVEYKGVDQRELGLEKYVQQVVERLCAAIRPDKSSGESPLLPRLERFRPRGSTKEVLFRTARPTRPTLKSHISHVVLE